MNLGSLKSMLTFHPSTLDLFERLENQLSMAHRTPVAEVLESGESYTIRLELPGVDKNKIDVKATDRTLRITAERYDDTEEEPGKPWSSNRTLFSEFAYGGWSRTLRFSQGINTENVKAKYVDGILEVVAGKIDQHTSISVEISDT